MGGGGTEGNIYEDHKLKTNYGLRSIIRKNCETHYRGEGLLSLANFLPVFMMFL